MCAKLTGLIHTKLNTSHVGHVDLFHAVTTGGRDAYKVGQRSGPAAQQERDQKRKEIISPL
jgi:hypothetical protein